MSSDAEFRPFVQGLNVDGSSGAPELEARMAHLLNEAFKVWKERQKKYGTGNISRRGPSGILVRMDDKLARLERVIDKKANPDTSDETLRDTCIDITNYILMLYLCETGHWPGWPHD
jgi:hypothetical protein